MSAAPQAHDRGAAQAPGAPAHGTHAPHTGGPPGGEPLTRAIGTRALAANVFNLIVGSGIFVLPASVAGILGPAAVLAYLVCAVLVGLIALCFAECGSRVAASGGPYAYIEAAFGPYAGALAGGLAWLSNLVGSAAVATVLVGSLAGLWPALAAPAPRTLLLAATYGGLAALNLRGVAGAARFLEAVTVAKLAPLVLLAVVGFAYADPANFGGWEWPSAADLGAATLVLVFAFLGVEAALQPSGEVRDPARTVPRALALGLLLVAGLYGALQFAAQGVLGAALATEPAPLAAVAREIGGAPGGGFVLLAAAISTFGYLAADMLGSPRVAYALARDGTLPAALARVHPRTHVPRTAILVHATLGFALASTASFAWLAVVTVVASLLLYAGCAFAALRLRRAGVRLAAPPFVTPGGPLVPLAALAAILWLLAQATWQEFAACAAAMALVSVVYALRRCARP